MVVGIIVVVDVVVTSTVVVTSGCEILSDSGYDGSIDIFVLGKTTAFLVVNSIGVFSIIGILAVV
jgi:hypothetical protein